MFQNKDCLSRYGASHCKNKIDGLVQDRHNSSGLAMELCLAQTHRDGHEAILYL